MISEYSINGGLLSPVLSQSTTKPMSFDAHIPQAGAGINPYGSKSKNVIDTVSSMIYQNDKDFVGKGAQP